MPPRTKPHTVATNSMRFFYTYNYLFFFLRKCSIVASESVVLKSHSSQKSPRQIELFPRKLPARLQLLHASEALLKI